MNNLVVTRGKEIIISLLIIILILVFLLFRHTVDPRIADNLDNFTNLLLDPQQNVHGVVLAAPDKDGKLVILDKYLNPIEPCIIKPKEKLQIGDQVLIEDKCREENFIKGEDQIVALSAGKRVGNDGISTTIKEGSDKIYAVDDNLDKDKPTSLLWITQYDKTQTKARICKNSDGTISPYPPNCY